MKRDYQHLSNLLKPGLPPKELPNGQRLIARDR
jgi:hypothetical protein